MLWSIVLRRLENENRLNSDIEMVYNKWYILNRYNEQKERIYAKISN